MAGCPVTLQIGVKGTNSLARSRPVSGLSGMESKVPSNTGGSPRVGVKEVPLPIWDHTSVMMKALDLQTATQVPYPKQLLGRTGKALLEKSKTSTRLNFKHFSHSSHLILVNMDKLDFKGSILLSH